MYKSNAKIHAAVTTFMLFSVQTKSWCLYVPASTKKHLQSFWSVRPGLSASDLLFFSSTSDNATHPKVSNVPAQYIQDVLREEKKCWFLSTAWWRKHTGKIGHLRGSRLEPTCNKPVIDSLNQNILFPNAAMTSSSDSLLKSVFPRFNWND